MKKIYALSLIIIFCVFSFSSNAKQLEYGLYGGIALYPGKHWGLFYEHGTGTYIDKRFGLSLKF